MGKDVEHVRKRRKNLHNVCQKKRSENRQRTSGKSTEDGERYKYCRKNKYGKTPPRSPNMPTYSEKGEASHQPARATGTAEESQAWRQSLAKRPRHPPATQHAWDWQPPHIQKASPSPSISTLKSGNKMLQVAAAPRADATPHSTSQSSPPSPSPSQGVTVGQQHHCC